LSVGLAGVRVVDFGHYIAGPLAALLLADAGADVAHVERPGEPALARADSYLNRGKRRLTLDLKTVGSG
jgi:crotonobetainyl-CoA:carnitine CoA-transferase CaiB-like acyl-CoA transferase